MRKRSVAVWWPGQPTKGWCKHLMWTCKRSQSGILKWLDEESINTRICVQHSFSELWPVLSLLLRSNCSTRLLLWCNGELGFGDVQRNQTSLWPRHLIRQKQRGDCHHHRSWTCTHGDLIWHILGASRPMFGTDDLISEPVVWKPGDSELVEWSVVERGLCDVCVLPWSRPCWAGVERGEEAVSHATTSAHTRYMHSWMMWHEQQLWKVNSVHHLYTGKYIFTDDAAWLLFLLFTLSITWWFRSICWNFTETQSWTRNNRKLWTRPGSWGGVIWWTMLWQI